MEAHLSQNNIEGKVQFTQHNKTTVKVTINLNDTFHLFTNNVAKIHKYPVHYGQCEGYGDEWFDIATLAGEHLKATMEFFTTQIKIAGKDSVLGSAIVITTTTGEVDACAPILAVGSEITRYAVAAISNSEIAGKFEFIQDSTGTDTLIVGQVSHSDGTSMLDNSSLKWVVSDVIVDSMVPNCPESLVSFNPFGRSGSPCDELQQDTCMIGELSKKHGMLSIGVNGTKIKKGVDINLPLFGENSIIDRYLVISRNDDKNKVLGCGIIKISGPLEATSEFVPEKNEGVSGTVVFKQASPYHDTELKVNLEGLANRTGGYHVHLYPIADPSNSSCSAASVGGHLNPFNITQSESPKPGQGTLFFYFYPNHFLQILRAKLKDFNCKK